MADPSAVRTPTIVVAGDVMIDWNLTVDRDAAVATRSWREAGKVNRLKQLGGAWLLEELIRQFIAATPDKARGRNAVVRGMAEPDRNESEIHQTYTVLERATDDVWRVKDFLGVQRVGDGDLILDDDPEADIVALLDSDLGFDKKASWPRAIDAGKPWIVFKSSVPAFDAPLWHRLITDHAGKLIVVMTVEDLRRREIQLLRRLSWERAAQDLANEMRGSAALRGLEKCKHVIVSFGTAGAMLLSCDDSRPRLVFDPAWMEGEWEATKEKSSGLMIGYTTVLAAAVTHEVLSNPETPQLTDAIARGIAGMRALFEGGFGSGKVPTISTEHIPAAALKADAERAVSIAPITDLETKTWTILEDRLEIARNISPKTDRADALYELAARVAVYGPEVALAEVPQLKVGNLISVDRDEIESLRSVKGLVSEYIQRKPSKPFSIAVFGSPGSGKSFGVEEIANQVGGKRIKLLTFNLTQFARSEDLHGAFHQVRDVSLSGKIPVVFWDEFDTTYEGKSLGWLRYFIGPMQDGLFQQDEITHPIGTSIFVFAGGTASTKEQFVNPKASRGRDRAQTESDRKALKVPDFISRLKGFLNVTGPNRRDPRTDPHYLIRRAILLRSLIRKHCPDLFVKEGKTEILQIDPRVLLAFLTTKNYRHGARSLESVIAMSALAGRRHFDSSSLPPDPQLALHVELPFESLSDDFKFTYDVVRLEKLAAMAHEAFRKAKGEKGWTYDRVRDDDLKHHDLLKPYAELREHDKEANRATVRWIPEKIASEGYEMVPVGSAQPATMTADEKERLAEMEHNRWMDSKHAAGYEWGPKTTTSPKRSPYLVPWEKLDPDFQYVDRQMVEAIPDMLREAGYILVKTGR